jgi:hypothetical protein
MKFLTVKLPPFSRHLIPLRSKYSSQGFTRGLITTLMMEVVITCETYVTLCEAAWPNIPKDSYLKETVSYVALNIDPVILHFYMNLCSMQCIFNEYKENILSHALLCL